jgi:hypothetical protein
VRGMGRYVLGRVAAAVAVALVLWVLRLGTHG